MAMALSNLAEATDKCTCTHKSKKGTWYPATAIINLNEHQHTSAL